MCTIIMFQIWYIDITHVLLLGDFNFTDIEWNTLSGQSYISQQFCDLIFDLGLDHLPTHNKGNILDLLLTNMEDSIDSIKVHSTSPLLISYHYSITFNLLLNKLPTKKTTYYSYNYYKGDYQGLYDHLLHTNLSSCFLSDHVEFIWEAIKLAILNAIRLFIPFNKIYCSHQPSWFNIRDHIKCMKTLHHKYKQHPTEFLEEKIKSSEESLQEEISNSKANYELYLIRESQ